MHRATRPVPSPQPKHVRMKMIKMCLDVLQREDVNISVINVFQKRETGGFNSSSLSRSRLSDWDVQTQGRFDSKHIFFSHCGRSGVCRREGQRSWQLNPSTLFCWRIFNLWAGHLRQTGGKIWFIHNRDSRSRAVTGACERLDPM